MSLTPSSMNFFDLIQRIDHTLEINKDKLQADSPVTNEAMMVIGFLRGLYCAAGLEYPPTDLEVRMLAGGK